MMQIGKYNLMRMNDGTWIVSWMDTETRHRNSFIIDNLEEVLDEVVKPRQNHINEFIRVFRLAMMPELFIADSFCNAILNNMNYQEEIPGWHAKTGYERFMLILNQFLNSFAIVKGIKLRPDEVEPYLLDVREIF